MAQFLIKKSWAFWKEETPCGFGNSKQVRFPMISIFTECTPQNIKRFLIILIFSLMILYISARAAMWLSVSKTRKKQTENIYFPKKAPHCGDTAVNSRRNRNLLIFSGFKTRPSHILD